MSIYAGLGISRYTVATFFGGHGVGRASGHDRSEIEISFDLQLSAPSSWYPFATGVLGGLTLGFGRSGTDWEIAIRD